MKTSKGKEASLKDKEMAQSKVNVTSVYNKSEDYKPISGYSGFKEDPKKNDKQIKQFKELIEDAPICDLQKLKKLAWSGVPAGKDFIAIGNDCCFAQKELRGVVWKILLEYLPLSKDKRDAVLLKKRQEYISIQRFHFGEGKDDYRNENEKKTLKIIESDVLRTQPDCPLYHVDCIQKMLIRLLTIWHIRHPASGYVQGMNDLTCPFLAVFLSDYIAIDYDTFNVPEDFDKIITPEKLEEVEADMYYCLCKVLDGIQDNYTNAQPGTQRSVSKIREVLKRMDNDLLEHFEKEEINLMQIVIRWVFCLLIREFPLKLGLRLFDTYISDDEGFTTLHIYVCTAILLKWAQKIKKMQFHEIMLFLQNLPTKEWGAEDLQMIIAEAYVYKSLFESSNPMVTSKMK